MLQTDRPRLHALCLSVVHLGLRIHSNQVQLTETANTLELSEYRQIGEL